MLNLKGNYFHICAKKKFPVTAGRFNLDAYKQLQANNGQAEGQWK